VAQLLDGAQHPGSAGKTDDDLNITLTGVWK
jgi:hypothetical protein